MSDSLIHSSNNAGVLTLTIARPEALNALNATVISQLAEAIENAQTQADVQVIILTGSGEKAFVAGADIKEFADFNAKQGKQLAQHGQDHLFNRIERSTKPVIAAINGFALGGGLELALACHVRIASENARMGLPEVSLGVIPGYGGTQRLPRLVGMAHALEMIPQAKILSAQAALSIGLIDGLGDDVVATALAVERHVLETALPPGHRAPPAADPNKVAAANNIARRKARGIDAARIAIELIAGTSDVPLNDGLAREREEFLRLRQSE